MPKLIHPLQSAFIKGRSIHDNTLIAHEIFHSFRDKKGKGGWVALKLDMEKAYDKLNWKFLFFIMQKFGFDAKFVNWIQECIQTTSMSILINNDPTDHFKPSQGLRKGDPLSPYLFILASEVLARMLQRSSLNPKGGIGIKITRGGSATPFLAFTDDILIFLKAKSQVCKNLKELLDDYCSISGQKVNYQKSAF